MFYKLTVLFCLTSVLVVAQNKKINAAWRSLSDYQATLQEGKPDVAFLTKAKEVIDAAVLSDETKTNPKAWLYKTQTYYELFKYNLKEEEAKNVSVLDKNQRLEMTYGNVSTSEFEQASSALEQLSKLDTKAEYKEELKVISSQMLVDISNISVGQYKTKKYDKAGEYFNDLYNKYLLMGRKDTVSLYNAALSAQKGKNYEKVKEYNQKMIDEKVANAYTYQSLFDAKMALKDSIGAVDVLKQGRQLFPNDFYLMNRETEFYLQQGKQQEALINLQKAIEKEPKNAQLYLVTGNVYDNLANPKSVDGKDAEKPQNFDELILKAEEHYKKSIDLKPTSEDSYFNALYNLGALYNNYGGYVFSKGMKDATIAKLATKQREIEAKSQEYYKKAIPYLEQALTIKSSDRSTITALRKLYKLVGEDAKSKEMDAKLK